MAKRHIIAQMASAPLERRSHHASHSKVLRCNCTCNVGCRDPDIHPPALRQPKRLDEYAWQGTANLWRLTEYRAHDTANPQDLAADKADKIDESKRQRPGNVMVGTLAS